MHGAGHGPATASHSRTSSRDGRIEFWSRISSVDLSMTYELIWEVIDVVAQFDEDYEKGRKIVRFNSCIAQILNCS
jgi:hypothetical protein